MATAETSADLEQADGREPRAFALRIGFFYAALFLIFGVHLPYLPMWLDWRGLTPAEISAVTAAPFFLRLAVTPAAAFLADRSGAHRLMMVVFGWAGLAAVLLLSQMQGFWLILMASVIFALATATLMPLNETLAVSGVRASGLDYGRMRLWGSMSFIAASFVGGVLVERMGAGISIWVIAVGSAATVVAAHLLPALPSSGRTGGSDRTRPASHSIDILRLFTSPLFLTFLLAAGTIQGAHATFYTFGALHWRAQGISAAWIGALWAIGVLAEIMLFAYSSAVVRRFGAVELLLAGAGAAVLRWAIMSLDPPLAVLVPLQVVHGLTYGAAHLGAIYFIGRAVPEGAGGTAQALYATTAAGLAHGGATLASGVLYAAYGGRAYLAMAALALVGLFAGLILKRGWRGTELWCRQEREPAIADGASGVARCP